ncbi:MAG: EAL domain-containing protein, partial [Acidimicrobiales bacterium]
EDAHTSTEVRLAEAVRLLAEGAVDEAVTVMDEAAGIVKRAGLRQEYVAPVMPWLATALRQRIEVAPPFRTLTRRAAVHRAAEVARRARVESRDYRNNRPHALREQGLVAALRGQGWRARRLFALSLAEAERQDARYEQALTREAWGRVGETFGWRGAADLRAEAEGDLRSILPAAQADSEAADIAQASHLSLADRFEALQAVARRIAAAPSADAVYAAVVEGSLTLLRGESCQVVAVTGSELAEAAGGEASADAIGESLSDSFNGDHFSQTLVRRAVEARTPVVSGHERRDQASDSVVLLGLRSVLCAPIVCEDEVVACFSVIHRQIGDLFSRDEVTLAEFIATLAGAALEHVAGTEARLRSLAQNSSDVITIVDRNGIVTYQSSSISRVFGLEPQDQIGRPFGDWVHADDAPQVLDTIAGAVAGNTVRPVIECRLRHGDGSWRHVETALNDLYADPSVRGLVLNSRDVSERKELEEELRQRALHDDLTGLANRGLFTDRLEHSLARRSDVPAAVLFIDMDDFKGINDSLGHAAGDQLLKDVARRLLTCVRPHDTVARLGGDEFAILLEEANEAQARRVAERVMAAMAPAFELAGEQVRARSTVGVAIGDTGGGAAGAENTGEELLSRADAAMYVAKARGKGRYEVFEPSMRVAALDRVMIKSDLQWAVHGEELESHYQPVMALGTGDIVGFEAMLRWRHPTKGLLYPTEFIAVAEESGLIVPVGAWALRQACFEGRRLQEAHPERGPFGMSVNVSTRQLQHNGLVTEVREALEDSGFDPRLLTLEITESATVEDTEATIVKLNELKALGVRLAIDDFGTGYSSLSYLRRFPVDQLKIDRSFIAGLGQDEHDTAIVTSVISLAHALGLEAVAEGVETIEQLELLTLLGCDLAQGFNWRAPTAVEEVDAWLTTPESPWAQPAHAPLRSRRRQAPVRTLLVDDRAELRAAIRVAMELDGHFTVIAEASDGEEAIEAAAEYQPDLVVLDLMMPRMGGLEALPGIHAAAPGTGVVLLSAAEPSEVSAAANAGTLGVVDKTVGLDTLIGRLVEVLDTTTQPAA